MSVSVTTVGGLVVVTQVFPKGEENKIRICTADPAKTECVQTEEASSHLSEMAKRYLRSEPKPLGIVQILTGLVTVGLGLITFFSNGFLMPVPVFIGAMYMLSGSFSVASHSCNKPNMIKGTLVMNTISALVAVAGVIFFCFRLSARPDLEGCVQGDFSVGFESYNSLYWDCFSMVHHLQSAVDGINGLMLVLAVLEFAVAVAGIVLASKAIGCSSDRVELLRRHADTAEDDEGPAMVAVDTSSDVPLLTSYEFPDSPPPYKA